MDFASLFDPQIILVRWPVFLFSLSLHEFFHAYVAYRMGDDTAFHMGRMTLNPVAHYDIIGTTLGMITGLFGWAKPVPINPARFKHPQRGMMISALAGPLSNLGLALTCLISLKILSNGQPVDAPVTVMDKFIVFALLMNISLAIFNLIPLFPLDGHHIIRGFLSYKAMIKYDSMRQYSMYGFIALIIFGGRIMWGILDLVYSVILTNHEIARVNIVLAKLFLGSNG